MLVRCVVLSFLRFLLVLVPNSNLSGLFYDTKLGISEALEVDFSSNVVDILKEIFV